MSDTPVSELFAEIAQWAEANGAPGLPLRPSLWSGETDEWKVEINCHSEKIDGLPYGYARLAHKRYGYRAILSPFSGCISGASEDDMIAHFRGARKAAEAPHA